MTDILAHFYELIRTEMTIPLATAADGRVTMRLVSPVSYQNAILIFTAGDSTKYQQLKANPRCCIAVGSLFAEAAAEFCGPTSLSGNAPLRDAYSAKFPDAFAEDVLFGGRDAEFILLHPTRITGWTFENGALTGDGIPTIPVEIFPPSV